MVKLVDTKNLKFEGFTDNMVSDNLESLNLIFEKDKSLIKRIRFEQKI